MGYAAAIAFVLFLIILIATLIQFRVQQRAEA
jgi:ABC-type sugar transport system permease subunit